MMNHIPGWQLSLDMVKPADPRRITLREIKQSGHGAYLFNVLTNVNKFLSSEQELPGGNEEEQHR